MIKTKSEAMELIRKQRAEKIALKRKQRAEVRALKATSTGKLIREKRLKMNLSQMEVAKYMHFTNVFLMRVESGVCNLPLKYVNKLTCMLKIPKDDMIFAMKHDMNVNFDKKLKSLLVK